MSLINFIRRYGRNNEFAINILNYDRFVIDSKYKELIFFKNGKKDISFIFDQFHDCKKELDEISKLLNKHYSQTYPSKNDFL